MNLSIVTINYNNVVGLEKTLKSIAKLDGDAKIEHVIIDGGSIDGSVEAIEAYASVRPRVTFKSEPDSGIYNAMNKGIAISQGTHIAFLNSGDTMSTCMSATKISHLLSEYPDADGIYGNVRFIDSSGHISRVWVSYQANRWSFLYGWMPPHPMLIIRKELFELYGVFDEHFKIAADYDLIIRFFFKHKRILKFSKINFVDMEAGGVSNSSWLQILKANVEVLQAWSKYYFPLVPIWVFICKPLSKLRQLL